MTYFDYDMFCNLKDGDIIFFDELLNANPMVLNASIAMQAVAGGPAPNDHPVAHH